MLIITNGYRLRLRRVCNRLTKLLRNDKMDFSLIDYGMSLYSVARWNSKTFERVRNECLEERQWNGVYTLGIIGFEWLHYNEYRVFRDIIELRHLSETDATEAEFREWRSKLFNPSTLYQKYQSLMVRKDIEYLLPARQKKKLTGMLSCVPKSIIESMRPQQQLDEMISSNKSVRKLIEDLDLMVI